MDLPSLRLILTRVFKDLEESQPGLGKTAITTGDDTRALVVNSLPESVQTSLLVLHQIYPHLLLSSLDLLDNSLVTRYIFEEDATKSEHPASSIYYVRSSQSRSSRYVAQTPRAVYEVRPAAWHCTCPSFTLSAFSARNAFDPFECGEDDIPGSDRWGGEMRGGQIAICKHLLAVLIGRRLQVIPHSSRPIQVMDHQTMQQTHLISEAD
jgi:hypothetical protein